MLEALKIITPENGDPLSIALVFVPSEAQAALFRCHFWADYTTNMFAFVFPIGTGPQSLRGLGHRQDGDHRTDDRSMAVATHDAGLLGHRDLCAGTVTLAPTHARDDVAGLLVALSEASGRDARGPVMSGRGYSVIYFATNASNCARLLQIVIC